jgi:hypothetical protein
VLVLSPTMKAELLLRQREPINDRSFIEMVVWLVAQPVTGSTHKFKYRLAFVVDGICIVRYDNEAGKGDHRHVGETQQPYAFTTIEKLLADFRADCSSMGDSE